jgi:hypothetical protein
MDPKGRQTSIPFRHSTREEVWYPRRARAWLAGAGKRAAQMGSPSSPRDWIGYRYAALRPGVATFAAIRLPAGSATYSDRSNDSTAHSGSAAANAIVSSSQSATSPTSALASRPMANAADAGRPANPRYLSGRSAVDGCVVEPQRTARAQ